MPTYGQRPDDVVQDTKGNALQGVTISFYDSESAAEAGGTSLGSTTTDNRGRWRFTPATDTELWARLPDSTVWQVSPGRQATKAELDSAVAAEAANRATALGLKVSKGDLVLNVMDYGAVGDGSTNDTAAVLAAAAAASSARILTIGGDTYRPGATLFLPPGKTFNLATLSAPILLSCNVSGAGAVLKAPQAYAQAVLLVGHETSGSVLHTADISLPDVTKPAPTPDFTAGSVGVKVQNLYHSRVRFGRVTWFETAHLYTGLGQGVAYNTIMPGWVDLCKIGYALKSGTGGWVNQNTWLAGGITQSPNGLPGPATRRTGYRLAVLDGGPPGNNVVHGNTFVGCSFEGDYSDVALEFINAAENIFHGSTRFEQGTPGVASTADATFDSVTTATSMGLTVGDMVVFMTSGAMPGGLTAGVPYYVTWAGGNDFNVSATLGGGNVNITSAGSGLLTFRPPLIRFDNTAGTTRDNIIRDYNSYPGPLEVKRVGAAAPAAKTAIVG